MAVVELTKELIRRRSVTPADEGCQGLFAGRLAKLGFVCEDLASGEVTNLWSRRGKTAPLFVFAGHTDVVPPGPLELWDFDPFVPTVRGDYLYGRGAADMKGSLAAMLVAVERFIAAHPAHRGSIGFLLTSDEEGPAVEGTVKVVDWLNRRGEVIDYCLVGEPSSSERLGDTIKNGRRGSLNGRLLISGLQGHVAYPEQVRNPIHAAGPVISALQATRWDEGNAYFPPTSFQISNISAGTGASNVVPAVLELLFNFRFSTELSAAEIKSRVGALLTEQLATLEYGQDFSTRLEWTLSGEPFVTEPGELVAATRQAIATVLDVETKLSTSGGTSDARFIAPGGAQVIEFGPVNATIHQRNECILIADLERLSLAYEQVLANLLL